MRSRSPLYLFAALGSLSACGVGDSATGTDQSAPIVAIVAPAPGAVVSGQVNIDVNATDDIGVDRVRFLIDGVVVQDEFTPPFRYVWNTVVLPNSSSHVIQVQATDVAGNTGTAQITVTVVNGTN